jgi:hypothetical protein
MNWSIHFNGLKTDFLDWIKQQSAVPMAVKDALWQWASELPNVPNPDDPNWTGGDHVKVNGYGINLNIESMVAFPYVIQSVPISQVPAEPTALPVAAAS